MKITRIGKIGGGQDGVIWKDELFRFNTKGDGWAYRLSDLEDGKITELAPVCQFQLDKRDVIVPHSNSVFWGRDFYAPEDEFPLLYSNVYNNYAKTERPLIGVCCVYRLQRTEDSFRTTLVQLIEIGFCEDAELWKADPDRNDPRPYGNFAIDRTTGDYYAFVMRNEALGTRYFKLPLPAPTDGEMDPTFGVKKVVLKKVDIREYFDCPYHWYIQGATLHGGKIYSAEGFEDEINRPAIRVIDLANRSEECYLDLWAMGYDKEPELIDFYGDLCYYSDAKGNLYSIEF